MRTFYPEYHDIETPEQAKKDHYLTAGYEDEEEIYAPLHHTFDEDDQMFGPKDDTKDSIPWGFKHEFDHDYQHYNEAEDKNEAESKSTGLFLAAAANMYLDTTVTKFL